MRNGECPKCGSREVYWLDGKTHRAALESAWGKLTHTRDYACAECGYVESYLRAAKDRENVIGTWQKVHEGDAPGIA